MTNVVHVPRLETRQNQPKTALRAITGERYFDIAPVLQPDYTLPSEAASSHLNPKNAKGGKILLPTMDGFCFEKIKDITYLEASGNYTMLHFADARQILVCRTLRDMEQSLPEEKFVRIHRSHTVALRHLKKYVRGKGGYVVLQNGVSLTVSVGQKEAFVEAVKKFF